ncbi:hypothetical protein GC163_00840 [bacterium]|nr:hypothetical protein [bacterium]
MSSSVRSVLGVALCVVTLAVTAWGGQPKQQLLQVLPSGTGMLTYQVSKPVYYDEQFTYEVKIPVTVTKTVVVDGQEQTVAETQYKAETKTGTRKVCKFVSELVCRPVDLKTTKAFETNGQPISAAALANRCEQPTMVVVSDNDKMIPEYFASVFKSGTVVLALPPEPIPQRMMAPGAALMPAPAVMPAPPIASVTPPAVPQPAQPVAAPVPTPAPDVTPAPAVTAPIPGTTPVEPMTPALPFTPTPEFVFLSRDGADLLKIRQMVEQVQSVDVTMMMGEGSQAVEKVMKSQQTSKKHINTSLPWKIVKVSLPIEGLLPQSRAKEKLGQGETVGLMSIDGKTVDPLWLQNIKPGVLIVSGVRISSSMDMPAPPMMAPTAMPLPMPTPAAAPVAPPALPSTP